MISRGATGKRCKANYGCHPERSEGSVPVEKISPYGRNDTYPTVLMAIHHYQVAPISRGNTPPDCGVSRKVRYFSLKFLTILWFFLFFSQSGLCRQPKSIVVGVVGALSGPKAPYGLSQLNGAAIAVEQINRNGGWNGVLLKILAVDDRGEPGIVGSLMVDLVFKEKAISVIGSTDSGCTHVMAMVGVKTQIPHFTCVSTDPSITRTGSPWTFRTLADDARQTDALIDFLENSPKKNIGILATNSRYGKMGSEIFARNAKIRGFRIAGPFWISSDGEGIDEGLRRLRDAKINSVVLWTLASEGIKAVKKIKKQFSDLQILGGDGLATPAFFSDQKSFTDGVILTCPYDEREGSSENQRFRRDYYSRFGEFPDSFAAHAFDTMNLIFLALKKSDGSRVSLRDQVMNSVPFRGATGIISFDKSGNDVRPVMLAECREGMLIPIPKSKYFQN